MLREASIPVSVAALAADPFTGLPVVLLVDELSTVTVPISIGLGEATAIATELDHIELERPMTHQLVVAMLAKLGVVIERVEVHDLIDGVFYATICLSLANGETVLQDARPSDALALALHTGAAVSVTARVVDKLSQRCCAAPSRPRRPRRAPSADLAEGLEALADDAFGKWKV